MDPLLLDDLALVDEIKKLDLPSESPDDERFNQRRTLVEWAEDEGLVLSPPDDSGALSPYAFPAQTAPATSERPMNPRTFLTLMFAGAAAAAVVFHDRVALILSSR